MSDARLYVEGGGDNKELKTRCREGFHKLLERSGFVGRLPRIIACGSRNDALDAFETALRRDAVNFVGLLVDSEDPIADIEETWGHLKARDEWDCPAGATDDQVMLMTTCMETWIVTDRAALRQHYKNCLQESALPAMSDPENRDRHIVQDALIRATRNCSNAYAKSKRSFDALANVNPVELARHCPSFARMVRILDEKL